MLCSCSRNQQPLSHCPVGRSPRSTVRKGSAASLNFELHCLTQILTSGIPYKLHHHPGQQPVLTYQPYSTGRSNSPGNRRKRGRWRGALFHENTLPNAILSVKIAVTEKYGTLSREGNTVSVASPSHSQD